MSTRKKTVGILFVFIVVGLAVVSAAQENETDPVLEFYRERAAGQIESRNPDRAGLEYALTVRAQLTELERGGDFVLKDSARFTNHYNFGIMDSQTVVFSTNDDLLDIDLSYPNVFEADYFFNFYPNDTGGAALAIGFESDTVKDLSPVGLAVIDRNRYSLKRLYLHYPDTEKYERYSRVVSMQERRGFLFPDTVEVTYARAGIFSVDHFRITSVIDTVHLDLPPVDTAGN